MWSQDAQTQDYVMSLDGKIQGDVLLDLKVLIEGTLRLPGQGGPMSW